MRTRFSPTHSKAETVPTGLARCSIWRSERGGDLKRFSAIPDLLSSFSHVGAGAYARTYYMQRASNNGLQNIISNEVFPKNGNFGAKKGDFRNHFRNSSKGYYETQEERRNVRDGVVSKFRPTVNDEDFDAILALVEPFYRHAEHALMSLPQEAFDMRSASPQERFLGELPMTFTRQQSIEIGEKFGLSAKQVEYFIDKLINKGTLERKERGVYSFKGTKRNELDSSNQESPEAS